MNNFIVREAQTLLNTIMDEVGGFEASPEQWDSILNVLLQDDCAETYFGDLKTEISQQIIAEALSVAKEVRAYCELPTFSKKNPQAQRPKGQMNSGIEG